MQQVRRILQAITLPGVLRPLCVGGAVLAAVIFVADVPGDFHLIRTVCRAPHPSDCNNPQLNSQVLRQLHHLGLSGDAFALYFLVLSVLIVGLFMLVGLLVLRSRPDSPVALVAALFLVTFATSFVGTDAVTASGSPWRLPALILKFVAIVSLISFLCLFPTGRFQPRWTAVLAALGILLALSAWPGAPYATARAYQVVSTLTFLVVFLGVIVAQVYRYRKLSSAVERQQTKVAVIGIVATLLLFGALATLASIHNASTGLLGTLISNTAYEVLPCLVPLSLGIAVLRYRLWDIDILINRTLVYGPLTVSLAAVYIGTILALQFAFRALTGQQSDVAIVVSTLVIAVLFTPVRRRIQAFIDRRFYRRKYDAVQTLAAFQRQLRDEVDLEQLSADLVTVVQDTMQPAHVSLWLRQPAEKL
jgi:hypothetical protein